MERLGLISSFISILMFPEFNKVHTAVLIATRIMKEASNDQICQFLGGTERANAMHKTASV
jgi:hypothetical protein